MKNLIGNQWLEADSGEIVEVVNPATNEFIASVPNSTEEDVKKAVLCAEEAQKKWGEKPVHERGNILEKYVELVESEKDDLARLLSAESGKTIREAKKEIENVRTIVCGYVEKAKHLYGITIPAGIEKGQEKTVQYTVRKPLGVVACILSFSSPVDTFHHKVASALIMGNAAIVKPSSLSPLTVTKLVDLLREAGVEAGVIEIVHGRGEVVGNALAAHTRIHFVSLTGSTRVGIETMKKAAQSLTNISLQLGSNDAFLLHKDGDVELAVEETLLGRLYNAGQGCYGAKRFLIHSSVKEAYIAKLIEKMKALKIGNPQDEETEMGCLISEKAAILVEKQVDKAQEEGARIVFGGHRKGAFYEPTILDNITKDMEIAKDMEILGPVISIIEYDDIRQAIEIANQSSFGLSGSIITNDIKTAFSVAERLECGSVIINGTSFYRSAEMPFGGWKYSGLGNEGIEATLEEMSKIKTVVLKNILD